jgi:hypothetical protein
MHTRARAPGQGVYPSATDRSDGKHSLPVPVPRAEVSDGEEGDSQGSAGPPEGEVVSASTDSWAETAFF